MKKLFKMKKSLIFLLLGILLLLNPACDSQRQEMEQLVKAWYGKTIFFPEEAVFTVYGKDTVEAPDMNTEYKVLMYVDSIGCPRCKMKIYAWTLLSQELDSASEGAISYFIYVHPKEISQFGNMLRSAEFDKPICIDTTDMIQRLNNLPKEMLFQTFLLDRNNQVVVIGNPVYSASVRQLYKDVVRKNNDVSNPLFPSVRLRPSELNLGIFDRKEKVEGYFQIENGSDEPVRIVGIVPSCDCIEVESEKMLLAPQEQVRIYVSYQGSASGEILHEVYVRMASGKELVCRVKGTAIAN